MNAHPVHFHVDVPERLDRIHLALRLVLMVALGAIGWSSAYWFLYLLLPALAALRIVERGGRRYLAEDAPRLEQVLRWLSGAYAYLWLLTDAVPTSELRGPVVLEVRPSGVPVASSALMRILSSFPAVLMLALLGLGGCLLWPVGAIAIFFIRRLPAALADYFELTLRYQFRLVAYHLSLVDRYPSFERTGAPLHNPGPEVISG